GFTVPTEPFFVAMLFALPPSAVPLLVAAGFLLAEMPDFARRRTHLERAVLPLGDAWHAIGPALVLGVAGAPAADWGVLPVFVAAPGAQFAFGLAPVTVREWLSLGIPPASHLDERGWPSLVDALLARLG